MLTLTLTLNLALALTLALAIALTLVLALALTLILTQALTLTRYADLGGMEGVLQEVRELVEYPLTHPEIYCHLGVEPPPARREAPPTRRCRRTASL